MGLGGGRHLDDFSAEAFAAALLVFVPRLLRALDVAPASLRAAMLASYGAETRREAAITPPTGRTRTCAPPHDRAQREAIAASAVAVARRLAAYRPAVLPHYLLLYFDLLMSKVGGASDAPTVLGRMIEWVETCGDSHLFRSRGRGAGKTPAPMAE